LLSAAPRLPITDLLSLGDEDLVALAAPKVAGQLLARVRAIPEHRFDTELADARCWATCRHDQIYPDSLREGPASPTTLFGRGSRDLLADLEPHRAVAVLGARRASSYGREVARQLGSDLAATGATVISGLAFGVDACAHRGALDAGQTIAVLGCGPDIAYPAAHRSLWQRISEQGLVLSEFPPGAVPWRWTFPARNRIVAALAGMTVVVEAASSSGSLLSAEFATDFGREVGAVPGPVTSRASAGPNSLLAAGARVIRDAEDVLAALPAPVGTAGEAI
jgi:DNA processing protein